MTSPATPTWTPRFFIIETHTDVHWHAGVLTMFAEALAKMSLSKGEGGRHPDDVVILYLHEFKIFHLDRALRRLIGRRIPACSLGRQCHVDVIGHSLDHRRHCWHLGWFQVIANFLTDHSDTRHLMHGNSGNFKGHARKSHGLHNKQK